MDASKRIREAVARVSEIRQIAGQNPDLSHALHDIKVWQANRFANTYGDLLKSADYAACANFFLHELYSERDYSRRDAQFAKVAGAIELTFPAPVVALAVKLAELHRVTEELDLAMARQWQACQELVANERYRSCWKAIGHQMEREWQLATVMEIGEELTELTRKRGLRLLVKMMRKPAELAGLGQLQTFLEAGFDHFSGLARNGQAAAEFLRVIHERESSWMAELFKRLANTP
jgi:hypothetical protein